MSSSLRTKRALEVFSVILIGDGLISVVRPVGHSLMWWVPVPGVRQLMEWCAERPNVTRLLGLAQIGVGLWLDARLYASPPTREAGAPH
ncbi:hypothetical protein E5F05_06545 [Deinococcus metallilatus]|uniref:Uncharacterized protein n=1 Tax=Deinococcus metallilatus TaxID=1211322 RepID=A0AAJ5K633_9DEIO|nr:hypothetical protein [Deinococcus metallilatus]MBB5294605.1 hypothetical protein [Deinococcus metallilatus]QBY07645.1 hypothetical protein E5F05_06545 [Deinococcus metallilatus]RXJ14061.1 hypothetical protein ERJ73_05380 [Deinococcus metallilatus]TLK30026.1 hypothetical protein FCS05_05695 [Deinococcus metallilatus]GMA15818.1 hypothetical protein GCM10025871_21490 [Deinococcus metallilatus]